MKPRVSVMMALLMLTALAAVADVSNARNEYIRVGDSEEVCLKEVVPPTNVLTGSIVIKDAESGSQVRIPVALEQTRFSGKRYSVMAGAEAGKDISFTCYELKCTDNKLDYSWSFCHGALGYNFRLFGNAPDENYLSFVRGRMLHMVEVTKPVERALAIQAFAGKQSVRREAFDVGDLLASEFDDQFTLGKNCWYWDINVTSITKNAAGDLTVTLYGRYRSNTYTFVKEGEEWRRV